jgi:MYND finger
MSKGACEVTKVVLPQLKEMLEVYIPSEMVLVVIQVKMSASRNIGNAVALEVLLRDESTVGPLLTLESYDAKEYCVADNCLLSSEKMKVCSGCRDARYCSRSCQLYDYASRHRLECDEIRHIIASVRLHAKDLGHGQLQYITGRDKGTIKQVL